MLILPDFFTSSIILTKVRLGCVQGWIPVRGNLALNGAEREVP